ncbi:Protein white [Diplonema papillatum]|nr:Protein white [Diplonema papillatum]
MTPFGKTDPVEDIDMHVIAVPQGTGIARSDKKKASHQIRVDDVAYEVEVTNAKTKEKSKKTILSASLTIAPDSVTAIMGSTGAGKTTLLNLLANRIKPTSGSILVNGNDYKSIPMKRRLGYVMQHDKLLDTATVRESLAFAAKLQLPHLTAEEQAERVDMIIQELGLRGVENSIVGGGMGAGMRGISGGERKRVAIGLVLIPDPDILLLDEPSTGLDSFTAEAVVDTLKDLAAAGRTVICTIHQPSSDTFKKFDNLVLLSAGRVIYNGESSKSMEYMAKHGYVCDQYTNPPDYYMQVLRTGGTTLKLRDVKDEGKHASEHLAEAWDQENHAEWGEHGEVQKSLDENAKSYKGYAAGVVTQITALSQRSMRNIVRNPMLSKARVMQSVVLGLFIGAIFWDPGDDKDGITAKKGALFFVTVNQAMLPLMGTLHTFPTELGLVLREQQSSLYSMPAYFGSKSVIELPFLLFFPFLFVCIFYFMIGLDDTASAFFGCAFIIILTSLVAQSYGLLISSASPSVDVAMLIGPLVFLPFMLVTGFLRTDIPDWLEWLHKAAFVKWSYDALVVNEFEGRTLDCNPATEACFVTGDAVIEDMNLGDADYWISVIVLVANYVVLRAIALGVLMWKSKRSGGVQE